MNWNQNKPDLKTAVRVFCAALVISFAGYSLHLHRVEITRINGALAGMELIRTELQRSQRRPTNIVATTSIVANDNAGTLEIARLRSYVTTLLARNEILTEENKKLQAKLEAANPAATAEDRFPKEDWELVKKIGHTGEPGTEEQILARRKLRAKEIGLIDIGEKMSEESKKQLFDYVMAREISENPGHFEDLAEKTDGWKGYDGPFFYYNPSQNTVLVQYVRDHQPDWHMNVFSVNLANGKLGYGESAPDHVELPGPEGELRRQFEAARNSSLGISQ
ncbi:hypothetical protein GC207_10425 [bacterium]|nr:hypothetical protein [bacterium]